jgi:uncharacterized protein YndB with AHSA1/START domain
MSAIKQQTVFDAPVEQVWGLLESPEEFAKWSTEVEVTGVPTKIEKGSTFELTAPGPFGIRGTTTFKVEELDDLHEIKLRCQQSGFYSRWVLTEARGDTFADVEYGVEPVSGIEGRARGMMITRRYLRQVLTRNLDSLRRALAGSDAPS